MFVNDECFSASENNDFMVATVLYCIGKTSQCAHERIGCIKFFTLRFVSWKKGILYMSNE